MNKYYYKFMLKNKYRIMACIILILICWFIITTDYKILIIPICVVLGLILGELVSDYELGKPQILEVNIGELLRSNGIYLGDNEHEKDETKED